MPPRVPREIIQAVADLLRSGLTPTEVRNKLRERDISVSLSTIGKEAYRLGIPTQGGRRKGTKMPGVGGRPPGPGKKWSPYRDKAIEMRQAGQSTAAIAAELGTSRQNIERVLEDVDLTGGAE